MATVAPPGAFFLVYMLCAAPSRAGRPSRGAHHRFRRFGARPSDFAMVLGMPHRHFWKWPLFPRRAPASSATRSTPPPIRAGRPSSGAHLRFRRFGARPSVSAMLLGILHMLLGERPFWSRDRRGPQRRWPCHTIFWPVFPTMARQLMVLDSIDATIGGWIAQSYAR